MANIRRQGPVAKHKPKGECTALHPPVRTFLSPPSQSATQVSSALPWSNRRQLASSRGNTVLSLSKVAEVLMANVP